MDHYNPDSGPLRAIENVTKSNGNISPEKSLLYNKYMKKARDAAEAGKPKQSLELLRKAAAIQKTDKVLKRIAKVEAFLAENSDSEEDENGLVHVGKGFHLTKEVHDNLYPYQRESLLWFWRLHRKGKGGILGDDMGLGKTIQVVAFLTGLLDMQQARSVLIVLPVAVIINWEREFEKWAPGINLQCFHGSSKRDKERALMKVQRRGGVLLTSYGLVLTSFQQMIQSDGREFIWDYIILDEGHKIKNPGKTTKAVHSIPARHRFILTGTPIQNNLKEMWALFDFVTHGSVLGTIKTFMMEYGNPITRARERDATASEKLLGNEMAESLRKLIHPYFLRRTKADVLEGQENAKPSESSENEGSNLDDNKIVQGIPQLTRKNDFIIWLYLTETQIQIYKDFSQLDQIKELLMTARSPLAELTVLKKLCDHPRLLSARACQQLGLETTETIEEESDGEEGSSAVKDSHTTGCNIKDIDDDILLAESGKIQFLLQLLHNLTAEGHRTLVFSQSRKMLDIVEKILRNQNFKYMRMDGTVSKLSDREQRIKCFQSNKSYSVFLLTTQVGGVGLTLTGADRVVIIDPSWNPATDNQAVDRAYRIGQTKAVVIYRLITCGTVEEKIYRRQVFKESITKQATGASKNPYRYFSRQELRELFILDDPSRSKTQEQLQEMHSANRKTDTDLDTHIAFLYSLDSMYGISDHDLMFSQEAAKEENTGFESETEDYIQKRVQRAQDLVSAESDLTVQLKEQLNLNTQAPGVHLNPTELNTDRTRLRKEWEKAHGEPNDVHILKPGADYEERYVSKKIPEPEIEYDLTTIASDESEQEEIIEDLSDLQSVALDAEENVKEETSTETKKPEADFSSWVSNKTPELTNSTQDKEPEIEYDLTTIASDESEQEEIIEDLSDLQSVALDAEENAKEETSTETKKPEADFSPWVSNKTPELTNFKQDKESDDVQKPTGWEYVLSLEASPFTPAVDRKPPNSDKVMGDSTSHNRGICSNDTSPGLFLKDEENNDKSMVEDEEANLYPHLSSSEPSDKKSGEMFLKESGVEASLENESHESEVSEDETLPEAADMEIQCDMDSTVDDEEDDILEDSMTGKDGDDVRSEDENQRDGKMIPMKASPELPAIEVHGSKQSEDDQGTDAERCTLNGSITRKDDSKEQEVAEGETVGLDESSQPVKENNSRQRWDGEDKQQSGIIEGAVNEAMKYTSEETKGDVQSTYHNSLENETGFSDGADNYSEEDLEKDAQDFEMQCDLGSDDTKNEESSDNSILSYTAEAGSNFKVDGDKDDNEIKVSASSKSNVRRYSSEDVAGINDIQEDKEEGGETEKIREKDEKKMGERDADMSSLALSSFKPPATGEEVCVDNLSTQQFNDSLDNNMGDFSMSTPLKPSAEGKRSFGDTFSSFLERRDSLIRPKRRAARIIEDSDDDEEEETKNFAKPSCLVPDSDQSDEEEWHTAKKGPKLSSSFTIEGSDREMSAIEESFQEMVVVKDSEPETDEEDMSDMICVDSDKEEVDGSRYSERGKRCLFQQNVERRDRNLKNNSVEEDISMVDVSNQQNESKANDSVNGAALEVGEEKDEGGVEENESDTSWEGDEEKYPCSENLDDAEREIYYQCIDKAESYLDQGKKSKALRNFLKALNIDSNSQDLQLQIVALAREVKG